MLGVPNADTTFYKAVYKYVYNNNYKDASTAIGGVLNIGVTAKGGVLYAA